MRQIIKNNDQTLADVALQHMGDVEALFAICLDNNVSITSNERLTLNLPDAIINRKVSEVLSKKENLLATGITDEDLDGIGYWLIGFDFKIS